MENITFCAWVRAMFGVSRSIGSRDASSLSILDSLSSPMILPVRSAILFANGSSRIAMIKLNIKCRFAITPRLMILSMNGKVINN